MIPKYDIILVIVSVIIAVIASYTALELAGRVTATQGQTQKLWLAGGATAMGIGIWSMHFVGMLAYKLPEPIAYDEPQSNILGTSSLALAIGITTCITLGLTLLSYLYGRRLDEERRQQAAIVEFSSDAIIGSSVEGIITSWNSAATKLYGYSAEEIKGRHLSILSPPDRMSEIDELGDLIERGEEIESFETVRVSVDGKPIDVSLSISPIKNAAGKVVGASAIARDITERKRAREALEKQAAALKEQTELLNNEIISRKQAEKALKKLNEELEIKIEERTAQLVKINDNLRERDELFRLIIEGVKDYSILTLDPNGYITTWNAGAERIKGYKAEEIVGQHFSRFYPPEDVENGKTEYELEIAKTEGRYGEEGWRVRKDGSYFWANVVITALRDSEGNLRGFSKIARDITARKQDEERLRKWADIFQHTGQGLIISSPGTQTLEMINPAFAKMHGYTVEELTGLPITTIIAPEYVEETFKQIRLSDKTNHSAFETKHIHKTGKVFPVIVDATLVRDNAGQILYIIVNVQDITQRKQIEEEILKSLEKERELAELRSRFITMTSHEFRTPLAIILSSTELLQYYSRKLPEDEKINLLRQIETATKRMTQILDDILAINKAEAGKIQVNPVSLNLEKFCRDLVSEMQEISSKKHEIVFINSGDCTHAVMDKKMLRHILTNLLNNAIKYSPAGGMVEFSLACQNLDTVFKVTDTGIGIPLEDRQKLFEAFYRAQNVGNIAGTGLGLSIVKMLVDLHRGTITVDSEVGVGTTFTVTLPTST